MAARLETRASAQLGWDAGGFGRSATNAETAVAAPSSLPPVPWESSELKMQGGKEARGGGGEAIREAREEEEEEGGQRQTGAWPRSIGQSRPQL